ncbi:hypothetical protein C5L14_13875 [Labrys okinawensis]|uniref:Uncharacterized protein n=2 Tax=Labrys okinawensis TaxID=346911 RepID=A0A2S9QAT9_9HYPH|nr:hypothetical protein C5L14_13875 [Labrys okinawensis]
MRNRHLVRVCWGMVQREPVKGFRCGGRLEQPVMAVRPEVPVPTIPGGTGQEKHRHQKSSGVETPFLQIPVSRQAPSPIPVFH